MARTVLIWLAYCIRNVPIDNCVITDSNRVIAFRDFDGGYVSGAFGEPSGSQSMS